MNCYYKDHIKDFLIKDANTILGTLACKGGNDPRQMEAWSGEISIMRDVLYPYRDENVEVLFEYTIPRLAKRVDVVLLLKGLVFVLEFKVGEKEFHQADIEQVMDYALDLKNFHKESHKRTIVPILIATEAKYKSTSLRTSVYHDSIYNPLLVDADGLGPLIAHIVEREQAAIFSIEDIDRWHKSRYEPTPTIIEAASALYLNHTVEEITRSDASGESLRNTTNFLLDVIERSRQNNQKSICFVTGVPGAGKTLVGLNVAIEQSKRCREDMAIYLSGNGPLVKVLTAALAKDKAERENCKRSDAKREVSQFIQEIYNYREQMLGKIKLPIQNGKLEIDENLSLAEKRAGHAEIEHIAIFDEAQRSWNHKKLADWLARGGSYGNKRKVPDFPVSEAEFLIWSLNLRKDWAVIICLVGGGQEIHTGEAGIGEWLRAVNEAFPDWHIYVSDRLEDKEYAEGNVHGLLAANPYVVNDSCLHLSASMRSFRAEKLSLFVHKLLNLDADGARTIYREIKDNYPIALTRDHQKAKQWLKTKARGSERYGMIVSSRAERLRPLAIDVKRKIDVEHWFLEDKKDLQSSFFLEDVATEFDIQGLELDWTCVAWDGDLRYVDRVWDYYKFSRNRWMHNNQEVNRAYQLNAYRVLLTRARQGMVLLVPYGDIEDETRKPSIYDGTFEYLKSIGIEVI
ncbi:DNA/RNA helicase domain-containing protein [Odoribacter lunatus]|uniref:DNA/RNA helicase domain-containing protein n=1 Tax=Odoribacter lunatus TaxID=2941335 RepID=UPI00203D46A8|nr:DNA/RNA helicase domain-containing protein [Odoribacter lunatus]